MTDRWTTPDTFNALSSMIARGKAGEAQSNIEELDKLIEKDYEDQRNINIILLKHDIIFCSKLPNSKTEMKKSVFHLTKYINEKYKDQRLERRRNNQKQEYDEKYAKKNVFGKIGMWYDEKMQGDDIDKETESDIDKETRDRNLRSSYH